ncbi:hypothetical protein [Halalkalibacter oceani]|uniref:hypothetical protein n=1 Tax=Halalkalibacter oceani TaxID=1653776 RepID=UPI003396F0E6
MNRTRPVNFYEERLKAIDEDICMMISTRKQLSSNPGFPPLEYIADWSKKYGLYESLLFTFFKDLLEEERFRPIIEPEGFRTHVPVFKSYNEGELLYTIPFLRQYSNASVVHLNIDWNPQNSEVTSKLQKVFYELDFGNSYECRKESGSGNRGHQHIKFVITPVLPDNLEGIDIKLCKYFDPYKMKKADHDKTFV